MALQSSSLREYIIIEMLLVQSVIVVVEGAEVTSTIPDDATANIYKSRNI